MAYPIAGTIFAPKRGLACGCREGNARTAMAAGHPAARLSETVDVVS